MQCSEPSRYIVELDEVGTLLDTAAQVCELLDRLSANERLDLFVLMDHGKRRSWFRRLLGLSERVVIPCFHLQKVGEVATLTFLDDAWSEYRAMDAGHLVAADEAKRRELSGGEPTPVEREFCLASSRAFKAARDYLLSGSRPAWLSYRYVP